MPCADGRKRLTSSNRQPRQVNSTARPILCGTGLLVCQPHRTAFESRLGSQHGVANVMNLYLFEETVEAEGIIPSRGC